MVRLTFSFGRLVFLLCLAPSGLGLPPSLSPPLPFLVALALCFGCFSRPPAAWLFERSRLVCVSRLAVGCSLVVSPPPFLCLAVFVAPAWCLGVLFFFFFFPFFPCAPPLSPAFSGFRPRVPWASALCVVCFVGLPPLGSPCTCPSFVLSAWLVVAPRWLLTPPPFFFSRFSWLPLGAVCRVLCCAVPPWVRCWPRCVLRCCAVLCFVVLVGCRCLLRRALWRCPLPWGPVLCGAVFCGVPPCCVCFVVARWCVLLFAALLCAVCVPGCCAVRTLSSPLCAVLCFAVLVARVVLFVWCVLLLAPCAVVCRGAVLGLVARGFLLVACFGVGVPVWPRGLFTLWLVWFAVVPCFPVSCSVVLCCRVPLCCCALLSCCGAVGACFALLWAVVLCCVVLLVGCAVFCPVVVSACCGALFLVLCVPCLLRSVHCGALLCWLWCPASLCRVLWRCAVVWCCAVVLCCRFAVLFVWAVGCGLSCCAVLCCPLAVLFFARWWCLRAVVLFSSCCAFPVFSALCAAVPCFPVLCPVVLCCRLVPWCPVLPPCWVCFLRGCGCTYLKNRCKIS